MKIDTPLANLSSDQVAEIKAYETQLTEKFGSPVILLAFDK
ncbi:MAG: hypothetical protein P4N59_28915 [Negativicutes bacterium]|nr:hypothetical protein [Negativicutes bacterium]